MSGHYKLVSPDLVFPPDDFDALGGSNLVNKQNEDELPYYEIPQSNRNYQEWMHGKRWRPQQPVLPTPPKSYEPPKTLPMQAPRNSTFASNPRSPYFMSIVDELLAHQRAGALKQKASVAPAMHRHREQRRGNMNRPKAPRYRPIPKGDLPVRLSDPSEYRTWRPQRLVEEATTRRLEYDEEDPAYLAHILAANDDKFRVEWEARQHLGIKQLREDAKRCLVSLDINRSWEHGPLLSEIAGRLARDSVISYNEFHRAQLTGDEHQDGKRRITKAQRISRELRKKQTLQEPHNNFHVTGTTGATSHWRREDEMSQTAKSQNRSSAASSRSAKLSEPVARSTRASTARSMSTSVSGNNSIHKSKESALSKRYSKDSQNQKKRKAEFETEVEAPKCKTARENREQQRAPQAAQISVTGESKVKSTTQDGTKKPSTRSSKRLRTLEDYDKSTESGSKKLKTTLEEVSYDSIVSQERRTSKRQALKIVSEAELQRGVLYDKVENGMYRERKSAAGPRKAHQGR